MPVTGRGMGSAQAGGQPGGYRSTTGYNSYAVQLSAILGVTVTVTASGHAGDRDFVLGLGAATFVAAEEGTGGDATAGKSFEVVVDTVGGDVLDASYGMAHRGGRLVTLAAPPSAQKAATLGVHAMFFVVAPDAGVLTA